MKEKWINDDKCTGCMACANICPKNAIEMRSDKSGFKHPVVSEKCIDCGLCERICKNRLEDYIVDRCDQKVYAAWSLDKDNRFNSTSGGIYSEIAKCILDNNGYLCGAIYNNDNLVEHFITNKYEDLSKLRQSKYIQSDIQDSFKKIKELLDNNRLVGFCGSPCQTAALLSFLGKDYDNLITIDFICRGMNSPKAYKAWLNEIQEKENAKVVNVWFKYKEGGWKKSPRCTRVDFDNGEYKVLDQYENLYMSGYLSSNLYIRPACTDCDFKGVKRNSDITLADFWGIEKELDDDCGTSLVIINTIKGEKVFRKINNKLFYEEKYMDDIVSGNVCFKESVKYNPKSKLFLEELDDRRFSKNLYKFDKKLLIKKIIKVVVDKMRKW